MKYETLYDGTQLDKIGFGTWTIGGRSSANRAEDEKSLAALHSALALGYRHFDTAEMYANGHSETLLGQALRLPMWRARNCSSPLRCIPITWGMTKPCVRLKLA